MDGSVLLDVTIGLVLLYLLIALFCTATQEWLAQWFNLRAEHLRAAITELLSGADQPTDLAKAVLEHPLVTQLHRRARLPSYLTSDNFTSALLANLVPGTTALTFDDLKKKVEAIDVPRLKQSLSAVIREADSLNTDAEVKLRSAMAGMQNWFDSSMDHASGWYKRRMRRWLLAIAIVLAVMTNADTIQVALKLAADSQLRARVAAVAATMAPADSEPGVELKKLQEATAKQLVDGEIMTGLAALPVGWQLCPVVDHATWSWLPWNRDLQKCLPGVHPGLRWLAKIAGLFATAIAAALGAPFWFGLLQQLNAIRSSGPKPVSSTSRTT